jgi:hypothetical protein
MARVDSSLGKRTESQFCFLNRTARPGFEAVRSLMEGWYDRFPEEAKADLRGRFRSDDPRSSLGAFWELYVHEIHLRLGYELERDPVLPDTTRRPDFLARRGDSAFYVEATIVSYSDEEMAARKRWDVVLDLMDEAFDPDFYLGVNIKVAGVQTPSKRDIVPRIEKWLASLDWADAQAASQPDEMELAFRDWVVSVRAHPRPATGRGDPLFPTVGLNRPWAVRSDERKRIEDDLREKSKYGKPELPFVVAALCLRDLTTERTIEWALFGPMAVRAPIRGGVGQMEEAFLDRDPRGLWQRGGEPQVTRVSAVLTAKHINPWLVAGSDLTLWKNPWAVKPLTDELQWQTVTGDLEQNRLVTASPTTLPREVLGLDAYWPASS